MTGFVMRQLGRIHALSDQVNWGRWRFDVVGMDGRRIDTPLSTPPPSCIPNGKAEPEVV
jgi:Mg2+/Co2+ transporter CorC